MSYTKEKLIDGDISDEEFNEKYLSFYDNFNDYMVRFVIPDAVDIFNCICDVDIILPSIEKILNIKYNLKITGRNPLKLEKYY